MAFSGGFDEMSRGELLDTADVLASRQRETETDLLRLAYQWAVVNGPETVDPEQAKRPGRERAVARGGPGTPKVAEFCGAALGARLGVSAHAGQALVADALDLQHRLPRHWARVQAGEVKASYARLVARKTRELDVEEADHVDQRVVTYADGRVSWTRFESLVDAAVKAADPVAAARREETVRMRHYASPDRATVDGMRGFHVRTHLHGIAQLDATVGHLATALAAMGSTGTLDQLRAMATVLLANPAHACQLLVAYDQWHRNPSTTVPGAEPDAGPGAENTGAENTGAENTGAENTGAENSPADDGPPPEAAPPAPKPDPEHPDAPDQPAATGQPEGIVKDAGDLLGTHEGHGPAGSAPTAKPVIDWERLLPRTTIFVHVHGLPGGDGIARVQGAGTVTEAWLRTVLAPQTKVTIRPVIDLANQAPVDAWEIPERHRQAVRLMTPADVFPYASRTVNDPDGWPGMQIDHTQPWQPPDGDLRAGSDGNHHATGGPSAPRPGQSRVGNYGPMTPPPPDQDPTAAGRSSSPSPASTSGATPTVRPTSSTTPAPAASAPHDAAPACAWRSWTTSRTTPPDCGASAQRGSARGSAGRSGIPAPAAGHRRRPRRR